MTINSFFMKNFKSKFKVNLTYRIQDTEIFYNVETSALKTDQAVCKHEAMKHLTFYQDVPLTKILAPNNFKKLRSQKSNLLSN